MKSRASAICKIAIGVAALLFVFLMSIGEDAKEVVRIQFALATWIQIVGTLLVAAGALGFLVGEFGKEKSTAKVASPFLAMLLTGTALLHWTGAIALVGYLGLCVWEAKSNSKPSCEPSS